jgi:lipoate-protein ligase A
MRVVRGAAATPEADRSATARLLDRVESDGEARLRVWCPPKQVAFGRRDAAAEGYERAREAASDHGYEPIERSVGGRAVAHTGTTVSFAYAVGNDDGIQTRYRGVTGLLKRALRSVDATVQHGEPAHSFCPGTHSLQNGGKVAGLAQRVRRDAALVAGYVVVRHEDEAAIATALVPVYSALGVPFDPDSVGSVEGAGGPADPQRVLDAIASAFASGRDYQSEPVEALGA